MTNHFIHFLTNSRAPVGVDENLADFRPREGDHPLFLAAEKQREILRLGDNPHYWYWRPWAIAIEMDPYLAAEWSKYPTSFCPFYLKPDEILVEGGVIRGTGDRPDFSWKPDVLPQSFKWTFTNMGGGVLAWSNGRLNGATTYRWYDGHIVVPDFSNSITGCHFGVAPHGIWDVTSKFRIELVPSSYPVDHVLEASYNHLSSRLLLSHYDLEEAFTADPDEINKMGILAHVITKATEEYGK